MKMIGDQKTLDTDALRVLGRVDHCRWVQFLR